MRVVVLQLLVGCILCGSGGVNGNTGGVDGCSSEFNCNENNPKHNVWVSKSTCNSYYGGFPALEIKAQDLSMQYFTVSMQNLLLSSRFAYWKTERPGLKNLFSSLSDEAFLDGIKILQHSAVRGGRLVDFNVPMIVMKYELSEIEALGKALDFQKLLANETINLIQSAKNNQDPEFAHWISDEISEKQSIGIHNLAGHVNNLGDAIGAAKSIGKDPGFPIFLYDSQILNK